MRGASCFLSESFQSSDATCSPFPCFPLRGFPLPEKNSANFIFFGKNGNPFLTSRLPLGGRLRREAVVRGASCSPFPLLSPLGKVAAKPPIEVYLKFRLMLRLPLASIKFCLQNFLRQKWESFPYVKASLRGEAPPRGGGEGRILFPIRIFSIKWLNLFALPLLSPSGLTLPNCRFKAISASMASAAAPTESLASFLKIAKAAARIFLPPL